MSELRTDEEQAEAVKKWWSDNGTSIIAAIAVTAAGWFGWTNYQQSVQDEGEAASLVFNQLTSNIALPASEQTGVVKGEIQALIEQLKTDYADTAYGNFGHLFGARVAADSGDFAAAAVELETLLAKTDVGPLQFTATARLAQLYIELEQFEKAISLTAEVPDPAYAPQYEEAQGDALFRTGDLVAARAAYVRALAASQSLGLRNLGLQRKVDSLVAMIAESEATNEESQTESSQPASAESTTAESTTDSADAS